MSNWLVDLLLKLTRRERALLGLMCVVMVPAVLWMVVVAPLAEARATAVRANQDVQALGLWVVDRAAEEAQLVGAGQRVPVSAIGTSGLEQSLVAAGLRDQVTELSGQADGRAELRFGAVPFVSLARWLSDEDPEWGYDIAIIHLERGTEPGIVAADLTLVPQK